MGVTNVGSTCGGGVLSHIVLIQLESKIFVVKYYILIVIIDISGLF